MPPTHWTTVTESTFPWELEALEFIRAKFPDHEPYRAWANFEFTATDGSINEVDLLVVTKVGIFLVEIKSRPGVITGDAGTWTWDHEGRRSTYDNPVLLTDRKCKKLKSLILKQKASSKLKSSFFVQPLIFCSHGDQVLNLPANVRQSVVPRDREASADKKERKGILAAIMRCDGIGARPASNIDKPFAKTFSQAIEQAGIRPSQKSRKVSDFVLQDLIMEGPSFQDWAAQHVKLEEVKRRVRIYQVRQGSTTEERSAIERAALREFQLLETMQHPGILRTHGFTEHELGSAIIFENYPEDDCLRLDHFLAQRGDRLEPDVRIDLVRQIANVIRFAHNKRVVHRSLSPQSILVVGIDKPFPRIKIFNWQVGYRTQSVSQGHSSPVTATQHVEGLVEDITTAYMAPEAFQMQSSGGQHIDIFSLGSIAYHIFSGQPPAQDGLELAEKIRAAKGLQISDVLNGAGEWLQMLIQYATHPDITHRTDTINEFVEGLNEVYQELVMTDSDIVEDPLEAHAGAKLPEGMTVIKELGSGASSKALLVSLDESDGKQAVLKVASSADHNERLRGEGEILEKLHQHQHVVKHFRTLEIGGRVCLLLSLAGSETLGDRLAKAGRLHSGLLSRFGEDLLEVVRFLEEQGIPHRDIKPHNIGVGMVGRGSKLHLTLFDFSLSRTPPDNIHAGTVGYLDPFLADRTPPRWDLHAERYSAAVTLFELATGKLPTWGDGSNPTVVDYEATIDPEQFGSSAREPLTQFFTKALRRDPSERFDNAEEMLRAWRKSFDQVEDKPATDHDESELVKLLGQATFETSITQIGLSNTALEALDIKNMLTVKDLLLYKPGRLKRMSNIVGDVRREIIKVADILRDRLGIPTAAETTQHEAPETEIDEQAAASASVDRLCAKIRRGNPKKGDETEQKFLESLLGLKGSGQHSAVSGQQQKLNAESGSEPTADRSSIWPSRSQLSIELSIDREQINKYLKAAHERWKRDSSLTKMRSDIENIITREGGVLSLRELSTSILLARGSVEEEPLRSAQAIAVARAAIETESIMADPRFVVRRESTSTSAEQTQSNRIVIALNQTIADYAIKLGDIADELATQDPLIPPERTLDQLRSVTPPRAFAPLPDNRLLRVAAGASGEAAVSSRQEIYPRGMKAERALKLSQGALLGTSRLSVSDLKGRIAGRYPESQPLPDRPELDKLLTSVGFGFVWDQTVRPVGAYKLPTRDSLVSNDGTSLLYRSHTNLTELSKEVTPQVAEARQFEERLQRGTAGGTFISMTVEPRGYLRAMEELSERFAIRVVDVESELIRELKAIADSKKVKWDAVLSADITDSDNRERLMKLVRLAMPKVEQAILESDQHILLVYPGLLARYDQMDILTRLREKVGRPDGIPGLWILIATDEQSSMPIMDGKPIPVIGPAEWARIPDSWLRNEHRSGQLSAVGGQQEGADL
jgi:serine/threonine protein kinase